MITGGCLLAVTVLGFQLPDSIWYERTADRDLTGDGIAESLSLTLRGTRIDSLDVRFRVTSAGTVTFEERWPTQLYFAYDLPTDSLDESYMAERIQQQVDRFFAPTAFGDLATADPDVPFDNIVDAESPVLLIAFHRKFESAFDSLVAAGADSATALGRARRTAFDPPWDSITARTIWRDVVSRRMPTFTFFSGGEYTRTVVWSVLQGRFYSVWECC